MKERRYVASHLQSLPVTRPALWDQSTLDATRVPVPLEGQIVSRNGKALRERIQRRGVSVISSGELLSVSLGGNEKVVGQIETLLTNFSLQQLLHADFGQLAVEYRLGETKAAQLQAIMPYRILCNGVQREDVKARLDLASGLLCFVPLHKIRYGIQAILEVAR